MYSWIWRILPFGRPGKAIASLVLAGLLGVVLWYGVFPYAERWLPNNDGQITDTGGQPGGDQVVPGATPDRSVPPSDVIPYPTTTNNPSPRTSHSR